MKYARTLLFICIASTGLPGLAHAADEDMFFGKLPASSEQTLGQGRTALWTLPLVATQYQPRHPTPAIESALQAQSDGQFLDALLLLDEADKNTPAGSDTRAELDLLRASFLLQGNQSAQALLILSPLRTHSRHSADAHALSAMALLQQGDMQQAQQHALQARDAGGGVLPHLALSYAWQGTGQLTKARDAMRNFNARSPQAITLAREAELELMLNRIPSAGSLLAQANSLDASHSYVVSVGGLAHLLDGQPAQARTAFEQALRRDPQDAVALLGMGLAETQLGNLPAGREKLLAADRSEPGNALILTYLGRAQQQAGQTDAALASWHSAQQADPKDPAPWLYQSQAELRANRLTEARESLRQAQARTAYRAVYRGADLLREDEQLLRINLAEIQRRQGLDNLAFRTLADPVGEKNATSLRSQAALLQGQRFGESARRSLLLQSQFDDRPGALPPVLDIYGDGAGQTGASVPQHGVVSGLGAQQASYHDYGSLFDQRATLEVDAIAGSRNTAGAQVRTGLGNDALGLGLALRQFQTDGYAPFEGLDNAVGHAIVQWRPMPSTQTFASFQSFDSLHGETTFPGDPGNAAQPLMIKDNSLIGRLGLRQALTEDSELRVLLSRQQTGQVADYLDPATGTSFWTATGSSSAHGAELQYRASGADHATQWGVQQTRAKIIFPGSDNTRTAHQAYAAWQQALDAHWQFDAHLAWASTELADNTGAGNDTHLKRWLPKLGLMYAPDGETHVRFAAWRGMDMSHIGDASLAPSALAGILLDRPGDNNINGRLVHAVALSADKRLAPAWLLEGQAQRRKTDTPTPPLTGQTSIRHQLDEARLALHWQPGDQRWAATLAWDHEHYLAPPLAQFVSNDSVQEQRLRAQQLELRWFAGEQWTATLALSRNEVDGAMQAIWFSTLLPYRDRFDQVDASLNWQFSRLGSLTAGVRNAADRRAQYTNLDPLAPRFSNGQLVYAKFRLAW
jgi:tetratricopeptide (TPR) repeat protein